MAEPRNTESSGLYPDVATPTIYADSVANLARTDHVVKFYLARLDPDGGVDNGNRRAIAAQVVMPMNAFIETAAFFEHVLQDLVAHGTIPKELVEKVRKGFAAGGE